MAKELPYFKFEPSQWENGSIQLCSHEVRGIFIGLCSVYWQRLGDLPYKLAVQKICGGNAVALDSLCDEGIVKIIDGHICIDFLNEQLAEFGNVSTKNAENARLGWEKRRNNATALPPHSDPNAIREEKRREENTNVGESLCAIFKKNYKDPKERLPAEANFYKDVDHQAELILQVYSQEDAVKQIKAYIQYCKASNRKIIGTAYKLSETILSSDWVKMLNPEARGPDNPFKDAEENKKIWTDEAWRKHYWPQISSNTEFKKYFML